MGPLNPGLDKGFRFSLTFTIARMRDLSVHCSDSRTRHICTALQPKASMQPTTLYRPNSNPTCQTSLCYGILGRRKYASLVHVYTQYAHSAQARIPQKCMQYCSLYAR